MEIYRDQVRIISISKIVGYNPGPELITFALF